MRYTKTTGNNKEKTHSLESAAFLILDTKKLKWKSGRRKGAAVGGAESEGGVIYFLANGKQAKVLLTTFPSLTPIPHQPAPEVTLGTCLSSSGVWE